MSKFITSTNLKELEAINKKINDWMIENISNYNAQRWGSIKKHPQKNEWTLEIKEDSRNPIDKLNITEKSKLLTTRDSIYNGEKSIK